MIIKTSDGKSGHGLTFTCGRGTEVVCSAIKAYVSLVVGRDVKSLLTGKGFGQFWRELAFEPQLRWLGPEKGVVHLALAAITNAVWDLWAKQEGKPLWKLLADMDPEELVDSVDFKYIEDAISKEEAVALLKKGQAYSQSREKILAESGIPAYVTSAGWLGYSDDQISQKCREALKDGFTFFKMKVGKNLEADKSRAALIRREIGANNTLAVDANQVWGVQQSIDWMRQMVSCKPIWIEEPTSPDDAVGHAAIAEALRPLGIGVATGEHCQNRILFKQLFQLKSIDFAQPDSCRLGGVSENIAVFLMAAKFGIPVCPHAGGVGLCEMVQHLAGFYHHCLASSDIVAQGSAVTEFADHLHEHFVNPPVVKNGHYMLPTAPGYSTEMTQSSIEAYQYPNGSAWQELFASGKFQPPKE